MAASEFAIDEKIIFIPDTGDDKNIQIPYGYMICTFKILCAGESLEPMKTDIISNLNIIEKGGQRGRQLVLCCIPISKHP